MLSRVSVSQERATSPVDALQLDLLSAHLADQSGFEAKLKVGEGSVTVTFSRRAANATEE